MSRKVVLGVGNTILTDDGVGIHVARRVSELLAQDGGVVILESERGGLDLVDLLDGFDEAIVVDAFWDPDGVPGTVLVCPITEFGRTSHLFGAHGVDLPTAIEMGRTLGAHMPREVRIVGIVVADPYTMSEEMTPQVAAVVDLAALVVVDLVNRPWSGL